MNEINQYQPNLTARMDFNASNYSCRELTSISMSEQQNKDITIFTKDGDKVTLSSEKQIQALYSNYSDVSYQKFSGVSDKYSIELNNYTSSVKDSFEYEKNGSFSISVEGDLDKQEMQDIKKAIKSIDKIMTNLLSGGDLSKAADKAMKIVNLDSISGIASDYSYEKTISVEHTAIEEMSTYSKEGLQETATQAADNETNNIMNLINEMTEIVKDSGVKPSKMVGPIKKLFSGLLKDIADTKHQRHKFELAEMIREELIEKIKQLPEPETSNWATDGVLQNLPEGDAIKNS